MSSVVRPRACNVRNLGEITGLLKRTVYVQGASTISIMQGFRRGWARDLLLSSEILLDMWFENWEVELEERDIRQSF